MINNYWAVLLAGVAAFIIGGLWYGPVFGKVWMRLTGMSAEKIAGVKAGAMAWRYALNFVGGLVMAFVLAHFVAYASAYTHMFGAAAGAMGGAWAWLGFIAPSTLSVVLWENKSWKLWSLNNAYYLLTLVVMGAIVGGWR